VAEAARRSWSRSGPGLGAYAR